MPVGTPYIRARDITSTGLLLTWPEGEMGTLLVKNKGPNDATLAFGAIPPAAGIGAGRFVLRSGDTKMLRGLLFDRVGVLTAAGETAAVELIAWQQQITDRTGATVPPVGAWSNPNSGGPCQLFSLQLPAFGITPVVDPLHLDAVSEDIAIPSRWALGRLLALFADTAGLRVTCDDAPADFAVECYASLDLDCDGLAGAAAWRDDATHIIVDTNPVAHQRLPGDRVTLANWQPVEYNTVSATITAILSPTRFRLLHTVAAAHATVLGRIYLVVPLGVRVVRCDGAALPGALGTNLDGMTPGPFGPTPGSPHITTPWFPLTTPLQMGGRGRTNRLAFALSNGGALYMQVGNAIGEMQWANNYGGFDGTYASGSGLAWQPLPPSPTLGNPGMGLVSGLSGYGATNVNPVDCCLDVTQWRLQVYNFGPGGGTVAPSAAFGVPSLNRGEAADLGYRLTSRYGQTTSGATELGRNIFWLTDAQQTVLRSAVMVQARLYARVLTAPGGGSVWEGRALSLSGGMKIYMVQAPQTVSVPE